MRLNGEPDLVAGVYPGGLTQGGLTVILERPTQSTVIDSAEHTMKDSGAYRLPQALARRARLSPCNEADRGV